MKVRVGKIPTCEHNSDGEGLLQDPSNNLRRASRDGHSEGDSAPDPSDEGHDDPLRPRVVGQVCEAALWGD